jgi:PAS domain S-box-containing protein
MDHDLSWMNAPGDEQYRLLIDAITDYAIYMLDPTGRVMSWNSGAERFKGYSAEEILGEHFSRFYTPEDQARGLPLEALRRAASEGRFETEGWRVRKDGRRFWAHVVIDPIIDEGRRIGFTKITRDITERREAQRVLEETQQALFQSQKLDSLGQLTGGMAHDFNNLLTAILGSLELLKKRMPDDPKARMLLENAVQGAQRGASLTQRMLAFARRQDLHPEPVDIAELAAGMLGLMERSIGPGIRIRIAVPPGLPPALSEVNQLEAALLNLVVNARDAMPTGGVITISADEQRLEPDNEIGLGAGHYVRLTVADTGVGMDKETLRRATEPFFTTKGVGKGTGLGLSMVHGLAEQSGGKLKLTSAPGAGATIEIWLKADPSGVRLAQTPSRRAPEGAPRRLCILVVDDDRLVLVNTTAMLEDLGHRVLEADSGAQALAILARESAIDLIITDQAMPGMSGLELARATRATRSALPIILTSGFVEYVEPLEPHIPLLDKPFTQAQLAAAIDALLSEIPLERGPATAL